MKKIKFGLLLGCLLLVLGGCSSEKKEAMYAQLEEAWAKTQAVESMKIEYNYSNELKVKENEEEPYSMLHYTGFISGEKEKVDQVNWYHLELNAAMDDQNYQMATWFMDDLLYLEMEEGNSYGESTEDGYLQAVKSNYGDFEITLPELDVVLSIEKTKQDKNTVYTLTLSEEGLLQQINQEISFDKTAVVTAYSMTYTVDAAGYLSAADLYYDVSEADTEDNEFLYLTTLSYQYHYSDLGTAEIKELNMDEFYSGINTMTISTKEEFIEWLIEEANYEWLEEGIYRQDYEDGEYYYFDFNNSEYIYEYNEVKFYYNWKTDTGRTGGCEYDLSAEEILSGECSNMQIYDLEYAKQSLNYDLEGVLSDITVLNQ